MSSKVREHGYPSNQKSQTSKISLEAGSSIYDITHTS